jgi:hypothetical protein
MIIKSFKEWLFKNRLYEMSNYIPKRTGLPMTFWLSYKTGKEKHGPRIKVNRSYGDNYSIDNTFIMTIEDNPKVKGNIGKIKQKDINKIKEFIKLNKEILLNVWNKKIDQIDAGLNFKKI